MDQTPIVPNLEVRPTVQSTRVLRPHSFGTNKMCCTCHDPVAHWSIQHPRYGTELTDICAPCFLYTSGWLVKERQNRVDQVVKVIGLKRGKALEYVLGEHGDRAWPPRLASVADADSVLGAIVLHDRFEALGSRRN